MTNQTISIPTAARGAVRAFVKSLPGFEAFAAELGVASREVKNAQLLEYAELMGKTDEVLAIIAGATVPGSDAYAARVKEDFAMAEARAELDADAVLASVEQFLSPVVRAELEKALAPLIVAANKPAVTVEKIVEIAAAPVAPKGSLPYAVRTGGKVAFNKLFGTSTSKAFGKAPISLWNAHGVAPQIDPFFVIDAKNMALLATAAEHESNVWLVGPSGSGKTSMAFQFAAYTGRPITRIGFDKQTSTEELVGGNTLVEGEVQGTMVSQWKDGSLMAAMKCPGMVILLDEPTFAPAGVQAIVQQVADEHRMYTIHATGEVVKAAPGVFFVIADNTNGTGDEGGQYAGTNQSNGALVNRFARMVKVDYLTKSQEVTALVDHTSIPKAAAEHVVDFVQQVRKLPEMEGVVMSMRQMVAFAMTVKDGFPSSDAFEVAFLTRLPNTERAAVQTLATLQWNSEFERLVNGSTASPEPSNAPSDSRAAGAFDDEVSATFVR